MLVNVLRPVAYAAIAALAVLGGWFAWGRFSSSSGDRERPLVTAPVERRTLQQSIVTRGSVTYPSLGQAVAVAPGRVTSIDVATGKVVDAGTQLLSVNGRPLIAIQGSLPFWRELSSGDEGADVRQLEAALEAEGLDPGNVDDLFTFTTTAALRDWQAKHGFPDDGIFRPGDAAPGQWPARAGTIRVTVGEFVATGQPLVGLTSGTMEVLAQLTPTQRVRVKEGVAVEVEVTGNRSVVRGTLGVPREAPATAAVPGVAAQDQTSYVAPVKLDAPVQAVDGSQAQVTILLAEVPAALVVPLAAIVMDGGGAPAVQVYGADGVTRLVPVTTGLSEGAFIEIRSGLNGDETVLLEQR